MHVSAHWSLRAAGVQLAAASALALCLRPAKSSLTSLPLAEFRCLVGRQLCSLLTSVLSLLWINLFQERGPSPAMEVLRPDTSVRREGRCAMRGSCGPKEIFGKPLPCPFDGPPSEVCSTLIYMRLAVDLVNVGRRRS